MILKEGSPHKHICHVCAGSDLFYVCLTGPNGAKMSFAAVKGPGGNRRGCGIPDCIEYMLEMIDGSMDDILERIGADH